jgi:adenylate kinase
MKIDSVIYFELPVDLSIKRLSARRHCPVCKRDYNLITQPPKNDELCDICNVKLVKRPDDKLQTVTERIKVYEKETEPLVSYYLKNKLLKKVNADQSIEKVFQDTINLLKNAGYN